jgi:lambda family phage tail tape measure protein
MASETELLMRVTVEASQAVRQLEQANTAIKNVQSSAQASTGGFKNMQRGVQNASYQFQDFIVQVTNGQDAMRAFGQQAPQLLMSFGAAGAVIGVVAALVPVLIDGLKSIGDQTLSTADAIKVMDKALEEVNESIKIVSRANFDTLAEQLKNSDEVTRKWLINVTRTKIALLELNFVDLRNGIGKEVQELTNSFGFFAQTWERVKRGTSAAAANGFKQEDMSETGIASGLTGLDTGQIQNYENLKRGVSEAFFDVQKDLAGARDAYTEFIRTTLTGIQQRSAAGEKVNKDTVKKLTEELAWVQKINQARTQIDQGNSAVGRFEKGDYSTTGDLKKGSDQAKADYENYLKITRDLAVAKQLLTAENERLNRTEFDVEASIYKSTEARKKSIELEQLHLDGKSRLNQAQYDYVQSLYKEQDAQETANQGRAFANQMLEKNVTALEKHNRLIAQANQLNQDGYLSAEELTKVMAGAAEEFSRQSQAISGITTAIGNAFSDAILNGKSFNDVLSGLARTIAEVIIKTQVVLPLVKALNQAAGNIFGPGAGINGASVSGSGTSVSYDNGNTATAYAVLPNATGNVYDGSNVLPFARGGVVTNPKFFPMSTGRGLMGEAGPEAVMPLRRGPDGKLGVAAATSGGGTQVNVYNQNGGEVETKERSTPGGGKVIDIYIKKAVADGIASGQFDKAMGSTYGLRRQGAR